MKKLIAGALVVIGLLLLGLAVYYWVTPAGSLPHGLPGYVAHSSLKHVKHGLAAVVLALGAWALAWFSLGKKGSSPAASEPKE